MAETIGLAPISIALTPLMLLLHHVSRISSVYGSSTPNRNPYEVFLYPTKPKRGLLIRNAQQPCAKHKAVIVFRVQLNTDVCVRLFPYTNIIRAGDERGLPLKNRKGVVPRMSHPKRTTYGAGYRT